MVKISEEKGFYFLRDEKIDYLKFTKNYTEVLVEILNNTTISSHEFREIVKNSNLKTYNFFCRLSEFNEKNIEFLQNLGFEFFGVEHNPQTDEIEEIYHYKYKEEFLIGKDELEDILEKLDIEK